MENKSSFLKDAIESITTLANKAKDPKTLAPLYNKFGWRLEYFKTIKEAQAYVKYWDFTLEAM